VEDVAPYQKLVSNLHPHVPCRLVVLSCLPAASLLENSPRGMFQGDRSSQPASPTATTPLCTLCTLCNVVVRPQCCLVQPLIGRAPDLAMDDTRQSVSEQTVCRSEVVCYGTGQPVPCGTRSYCQTGPLRKVEVTWAEVDPRELRLVLCADLYMPTHVPRSPRCLRGLYYLSMHLPRYVDGYAVTAGAICATLLSCFC
jgi:hypothetical protein